MAPARSRATSAGNEPTGTPPSEKCSHLPPSSSAYSPDSSANGMRWRVPFTTTAGDCVAFLPTGAVVTAVTSTCAVSPGGISLR